MPYPLRQLAKRAYPFLHTRHIRLKALCRIVIQCHLKIIMDAPFVQLMQIRQYRLRILCPKHNDFTSRKRHIHFLPVKRIVPNAIALCQTIEEPLGIKGRDVRRTAGGDDYRGYGFNTLAGISNDRQFINHDILIIIVLLVYPFYYYFLLTMVWHFYSSRINTTYKNDLPLLHCSFHIFLDD